LADSSSRVSPSGYERAHLPATLRLVGPWALSETIHGSTNRVGYAAPHVATGRSARLDVLNVGAADRHVGSTTRVIVSRRCVRDHRSCPRRPSISRPACSIAIPTRAQRRGSRDDRAASRAAPDRCV